MTEWDAADYARISGLQQAMAEEVLALLDLKGSERVLDIGCGNGKITAEIAARVPNGSVLGVDPSQEMIAFASSHYGPAVRRNLRFETGRRTPLALSRRVRSGRLLQRAALGTRAASRPSSRYAAAMKPEARAQLRLVPKGERKSLENVLEDTRLSPRWSRYFQEFHDPYLHLTPEEYAELAEQNGLHVLSVHTAGEGVGLQDSLCFLRFRLGDLRGMDALLTRGGAASVHHRRAGPLSAVAADRPGEENTFKFYQMDITLRRTVRQRFGKN